MIINRNTFVRVEKGVSIYMIEYILIHQYGYMYENGGDPHQDTQFTLDSPSDGRFHFYLYGHSIGMKYISDILNYKVIDGDYYFNGKKYPCITGSKLLRNYKLNKLTTKIKNNEKIPCS